MERARQWDRFLPPARPSAGELGQYRDAVAAEARDGAWALLGSTPEIRSLAAQRGRELTCVDLNQDVFDALAVFVQPTCTARLICANWLEVGHAGSWDVVFGDGSINMLAPDDHDPFLRQVHAMLSLGGLALLRVHIATPPRFGNAEELFAWHRSHPSDAPVFSSTRTDLDLLWLDAETLRVSFADHHRELCALFARGALTDGEFEAYESLMAFNKIELYYLKQDRFEALADRYFEIERIRTGGDYFGSSNHPIYALRRK